MIEGRGRGDNGVDPLCASGWLMRGLRATTRSPWLLPVVLSCILLTLHMQWSANSQQMLHLSNLPSTQTHMVCPEAAKETSLPAPLAAASPVCPIPLPEPREPCPSAAAVSESRDDLHLHAPPPPRLPNDGQLFSSHYCILRCEEGQEQCNEADNEVNPYISSCYLRNVCVDTQSKAILFFEDPRHQAAHSDDANTGDATAAAAAGDKQNLYLQDPHLIIPPSKRARASEFGTRPLVGMAQSGNMLQQGDAFLRHSVPLVSVSGSFPRADNNSVLHLSHPVLLTEPFVLNNFGHMIADSIFPLYRLLVRFGLLERERIDLLLQQHDDFHECTNPERGKPAPFCEGWHRMLRIVNVRAGRYSADASPADGGGNNSGGGVQHLHTLGKRDLSPSKVSAVCARELLVGQGRLGMMGDSDMWAPFNAQLIRTLGVDPRRQPREQRILVFRKTGRRMVTNLDALMEATREAFPRVSVEIFDPSTRTVAEQAEIVSHASVLVTPCGGISFSSLFLPWGASAIYLCSWKHSMHAPLYLERYWYERQQRFHSFHYPTEFDEIQVDLTTHDGHSHTGDANIENVENQYRNYANIKINTGKFIALMRTALLHAEAAIDLPQVL